MPVSATREDGVRLAQDTSRSPPLRMGVRVGMHNRGPALAAPHEEIGDLAFEISEWPQLVEIGGVETAY